MTEKGGNPRVTILTISPEQNSAATVESLLRAAGHNVHVDWLKDPQELGGLVADGEPGLICCRPRDGGDGKGLLDLCLNTAKNAPVVLLAQTERRAALMRAGARDVVAPEDNEHLAQVLDREFRTAVQFSELAQTRERLAQVEARLDKILAESQDPRATVHEGIHAQINAVYARLFGFDEPDELVGVPLMDLVAPEDRDRVKRQLASCLKSGIDPEPVEFRAQSADDTRITLTMQLRSIPVDGETHVEVLIPREASAPDEENYAAGFAGRASLYQALERQTDAGGEWCGLLYVCIDDLDSLQKQLGLPGADQVLNEVSAFLLERAEAGDQSFRLNISEFALVTERGSEVELEAAAESLRLALDEEVFGDETVSTSLTASIAIAPLGERDNEQRLLQAMHLARKLSQRGGNKAAMVADNRRMDAPRETDRQWVGRLQHALEHDRFALAYQPIDSLEGDQKRHFDVLLRLADDDNHYIQPDEFLEIAERHGLMPMIDQWVTAQVLELQNDRDSTPMFVTLSDSTIDCGDAFVGWLEQRTGRHRNPAAIQFVLSEQGIQSAVKRAQVLAQKLKSMGFGLAIGHYGATSKSTQLLERLKADFVKLDASFTEALGNDEDTPRLGELVHAARERRMKIIAEPVDDANSMARLWQLGVSHVRNRAIQEPNEGGRKSDANVA